MQKCKVTIISIASLNGKVNSAQIRRVKKDKKCAYLLLEVTVV